MSRLKSNDGREENQDALERRLRREAAWVWRAPPVRLRRRVVHAVEDRRRPPKPPVAPWHTLAWAAAWLIMVGVAAALVVRVMPRGFADPVQPAQLSFGEIDVPAERIDELVATYEAPLRDEARLLVADARTMHAALMRRLPYPSRGEPESEPRR